MLPGAVEGTQPRFMKQNKTRASAPTRASGRIEFRVKESEGKRHANPDLDARARGSCAFLVHFRGMDTHDRGDQFLGRLPHTATWLLDVAFSKLAC